MCLQPVFKAGALILASQAGVATRFSLTFRSSAHQTLKNGIFHKIPSETNFVLGEKNEKQRAPRYFFDVDFQSKSVFETGNLSKRTENDGEERVPTKRLGNTFGFSNLRCSGKGARPKEAVG